MVTDIQGFFMDFTTKGSIAREFTLNPFPPPGRNVFATISLSTVNSFPADVHGQPAAFMARAYIPNFQVYKLDGTVTSGHPNVPNEFEGNSVFIPNCRTITFELDVNNAFAIAQITLFFV
jgi:hypothetical protein